MSRTHISLAAALLVFALVAGVATLGVAAVQFQGDAPTSAEAGSELHIEGLTLTEPFAVGDEWTMEVSTELDDVRLVVTPRDGAGNALEDRTIDVFNEETVTLDIDDSRISTVEFEVRGDVPLIGLGPGRYSYEDRSLENITALEVTERLNGGTQRIENGTFEVHRFTEQSRDARQAIDEASQAAEDADSDDARNRVNEAITFYNNAEFSNAITAANEAGDIADSEGDTRRTLLLLAGVVLGLVAVGGIAYYWRSQQGSANKLQ